eukprot:15341418-Ditylum_brightwellii.AAC.2
MASLAEIQDAEEDNEESEDDDFNPDEEAVLADDMSCLSMNNEYSYDTVTLLLCLKLQSNNWILALKITKSV